ncbi:MAG: hypothetical protein DRR16_17820 [Candidatus Parabeggiatoa sp. nov. 3]|nr:MAG: hypothetical protein DRR00_08035 [Gammaproteobacteria bacterium]RKZ60632.1 MAG: hypothetical protein DRQ99_21785 [Gammaproteobacteria bacterium]RKZ83242.1 MAG: hypothetical protein DRR16_17820 [Gammaproteobacteria bacterium]
MSNKDDQDRINLLTGQTVADADPKTVREAQIFRAALLAHADRIQDDSEMPYPHIFKNVLSRLEKNPPVSPVRKKQSWFQKRRLTKWIDKINFRNTVLTWHIGWAFATVFVLAVSLSLVFNIYQENQIDSSYQLIYANKTEEITEQLRELSFRWEGEQANVQAFGPTAQSSEAAKAYGAGLLSGREAILGNTEMALPTRLLPSTSETDWLKTQWADYFELGRWSVSLWTASRFHREIPATFWAAQPDICAHFKSAFKARTDVEAKKVLFQLDTRVRQCLGKLPNNDKEIYKNLRINLEKMMYFLAPR